MDASVKRTLVFLLGITYGLGELLQHMLWGPNWLRWHLSDFGYALAIANIIYMISLNKISVRAGLLIGVVIGLGWEAMQFSHNSGDPIDAICIIAGGVIGLAIIGNSETKQQGAES